MAYPLTQPKNRHDLQISGAPLPDFPQSLLSSDAEDGQPRRFANSAAMFRKLDEPIDPRTVPLHKIASVYSYADAPDHPGALVSSLIVIGIADSSLSIVRRVLQQEGIPDCLHKCTLAVRLADQKHWDRLEPRHQTNSTRFAQFMKQLRKDNAVAIAAKDKYGRFAILAPIDDQTNEDDSTISPLDCAVFCYVGDAKEVMEFLTTSAMHGTETTGNGSDNRTNTTALQNDMSSDGNDNTNAVSSLWQPPGMEDQDGETQEFSAPWGATNNDDSASAWNMGGADESGDNAWGPTGGNNKRSFEAMNQQQYDEHNENDDQTSNFHADAGAAAADAFYSGLTRSLDTRADSHIFHMRAFNGWVKATQIQELDPNTTINGRQMGKAPLRILDLACGKGGDLNKWALHNRGIKWYVGIDVARGSLKDAAIRAREMRKKKKLSQAIFTVADLGADVPGRKKSENHKYLQKLSTWSLTDESEYEAADPEFKMKRGGGISESDRFDVVSIQFAIHYMMSSAKRARRFFHTVSQLLEIGGNLICTTIDARVVIDHLMNLGHNYHFSDDEEPEFSEAVVEAGAGVCKIKFEAEMVKKIVTSLSDGTKAEEDLFGLQYTFTLKEGSDHAAGVGDAVNLPEWLTPLPILESLAKEAGLELDYAQNFHEFYENRKSPSSNPAAHLALYNMKVLNRDGSISEEEWSISRLYAAIKFRKVRESTMGMDDELEEEEKDDGDDDDVDGDNNNDTNKSENSIKGQPNDELDPIKAKTMLPMAMIKAKKSAGESVWNTLSSEEKKRLTQIELRVLARKT